MMKIVRKFVPVPVAPFRPSSLEVLEGLCATHHHSSYSVYCTIY